MKIEIKHRVTGAVLFSHTQDSNTIRTTLELAVKARTNLISADLSGTDLSGTDLSGANLSGANLSRANLTGVNLSRANLSNANLSGAYLSGTDLSGANLSNANLSGAYLSGTDPSGAKYGDGIPVERVPLVLQGIKYTIIMDTHIKIGCKLYTHEQWSEFTDAELADMDSDALEWWHTWRKHILSLSLVHRHHIVKGA